MSEYTKVSSAAMQQGIDDLKVAHSKLQADLTDLEDSLKGSLAEWDGEARTAYAAAKAKWDAAADHMTRVINSMNTAMTKIQGQYDDNERQIQSSWA